MAFADIIEAKIPDPHAHPAHSHVPIIRARDLYKAYGNVQALNGVDLDVYPGTVLALLGPNGAGKTTLIRILTTLLAPSAGRVEIDGYDIVAHDQQIRSILGLAGQNVAVDGYLTGRENLELVGRLYRLSKAEARRRADILLEQLDLISAARRTVRTYSGGMRRRLDLAASLVGNPKILFLDEPTNGLDPQSRIALWRILNRLVEGGTTILLTTQYLDEADYLADNIVVIDRGKVIARGTADELKRQVGGDVLELHLADASLTQVAAQAITSFGNDKPHIDADTGKVTLPVAHGTSVLSNVIRRLDSEKIDLTDIFLRRPTLDDVFLALTGHVAESFQRNKKTNDFSR